MKAFAVLCVCVASSYAAPAADADPQLLLGAGYHHGLGLYGAHLAAPAISALHAAPVVTKVVEEAPAVEAAPAVVAHAAPVAIAHHAAPVAIAHHAAPAVVATAPVVHQVGYQVHHQVQHVPQVHVQEHVSTHTTQHVINHAPVVGAYAGLPALAVAAPAVAVAEKAE